MPKKKICGHGAVMHSNVGVTGGISEVDKKPPATHCGHPDCYDPTRPIGKEARCKAYKGKPGGVCGN